MPAKVGSWLVTTQKIELVSRVHILTKTVLFTFASSLDHPPVKQAVLKSWLAASLRMTSRTGFLGK